MTLTRKSKSNGAATELPHMKGKGVERIAIRQIDVCIDDYVEARDTRMAHTTREVAAKRALIDALNEHADKLSKDKTGAITYHYGDMVATLKHGKEALKVRAVHVDNQNGD
jgi:hypothetical protein